MAVIITLTLRPESSVKVYSHRNLFLNIPGISNDTSLLQMIDISGNIDHKPLQPTHPGLAKNSTEVINWKSSVIQGKFSQATSTGST